MTDGFARRHVTSLAAVLAALSIGLVVATVRGFVPASALPRAPDSFLHAIPALNAAISAAAIAVIAGGWRAIRNGDVRRHRALMGTATALFASFLALYLYRIALVGTTHFTGPSAIETFVYLPVLIVHMALAMTCIPLVYYVLLLAATHDVAEIPDTNHPRVGRIAAALWLVSFALGIVVFLLLYVVY